MGEPKLRATNKKLRLEKIEEKIPFWYGLFWLFSKNKKIH